MLLKNKEWNNTIKLLEDLKPYQGEHNVLWDLTVVCCCVSQSLDILDDLFTDPSLDNQFRYALKKGYLFNLNYLEESKYFHKKEIIKELRKNWIDLTKLEKIIENKKNKQNKRELAYNAMKQILSRILLIIEQLWLEEVNSCQALKINLGTLHGKKLENYIKHVVSHQKNEVNAEIFDYFDYLRGELILPKGRIF